MGNPRCRNEDAGWTACPFFSLLTETESTKDRWGLICLYNSGPRLDHLCIPLLSSPISLLNVCKGSAFALLLVPPPSDLFSYLAIREYDAKLLLAFWLERAPPVHPSATVSPNFIFPSPKVAQVSWDPATGAITPDTQLPAWVHTSKLVAKPDQLIKRRGKAGLLALNKTWEEAKPWIVERAGKPQKVSPLSPSHRQTRSLGSPLCLSAIRV
jgi:hypothetical protein